MGIFALAAICLVAILQWECNVSAIPVCPPNSTLESVSPCDLTCGNVDDPRVGECTKKRGCKCDNGFYAQTGTSGFDIVCVKPENCKSKCGPNKTFEPRAKSCRSTCEKPDLHTYCTPLPILQCACNKGYLLQGNDCVLKSECKIKT